MLCTHQILWNFVLLKTADHADPRSVQQGVNSKPVTKDVMSNMCMDAWSVSCWGCHADSVTVKEEPAESGTATVKVETGRNSGRPAQPGRQLAGADARTEMQMLQVTFQPTIWKVV